MTAKDSGVDPKKPSTKSPKSAQSPKTKKTTIAKKAISTKNVDGRQKLIATAAYYRAENRGFGGNGTDAVQDWLEAEVEIDNF